MDELDDVSNNEKIFMKLWNRYIKSNTILSDASIPDRCHGFITSHYKELQEHNLRDHLVLHLFNLWDNRLLPSSKILDLIGYYDEITKEEKMKHSSGPKLSVEAFARDGTLDEEKKASD